MYDVMRRQVLYTIFNFKHGVVYDSMILKQARSSPPPHTGMLFSLKIKKFLNGPLGMRHIRLNSNYSTITSNAHNMSYIVYIKS